MNQLQSADEQVAAICNFFDQLAAQDKRLVYAQSYNGDGAEEALAA